MRLAVVWRYFCNDAEESSAKMTQRISCKCRLQLKYFFCLHFTHIILRTGSALYVLGNVRISQNRLDDAFDLHKRALQCWIKTYGKEHHKTGDAYHKVGWHFMQSEKYIDAL